MRTLSALLLATLIPLSPLWADFTKEDIDTRYNAWLQQKYARSSSSSYGAAARYGSSAAMGGGRSFGAYAAAAVTVPEAFKREKAAEMHPAYRVVEILTMEVSDNLEAGSDTSDARKAITAILTRGEYFGGFNTSRQANANAPQHNIKQSAC